MEITWYSEKKAFAVWMWTNKMSIFYNECNIKSGIIPECLFETKRNELYNFIYSNVKFSVHTRFVWTSTWKTMSLKVVTVQSIIKIVYYGRKLVTKSHDFSWPKWLWKIGISKFLKVHRNQCFRFKFWYFCTFWVSFSDIFALRPSHFLTFALIFKFVS